MERYLLTKCTVVRVYTGMSGKLETEQMLHERHLPFGEPLAGAMVAHADEGMAGVDMYSERGEQIGVVRQVSEAQVVGAAARTPVPAGIPGRHQVEMGDGMIARRLGQDEVGRTPAGMGVAADIEGRVRTPGQDGAHVVRVLDIEERVLRVVVQVALRVAVQHGILQGAVGENHGDTLRETR